MSFGRASQQWATFSRAWYILNADRQPPGKMAALICKYLEGRHKPIYHPLSDVGDHVVVVNAKEIAFSGNKWEQKVFWNHTGRKRGKLHLQAFQVHELDDTWILRKYVYWMLPKNKLRRTLYQRFHVYSDDNVPANIMENVGEVLPQPRRVPKGISDYTEEEIADYPKLWTPAEDFLKL